LQKSNGALRSRTLIFTHMSPVWRDGDEPRIVVAACAMTLPPTSASGDVPVGRPSEGLVGDEHLMRAQAPRVLVAAVTRMGKRSGSAPSRPATAVSPSPLRIPTVVAGRGRACRSTRRRPGRGLLTIAKT
jgi:hypothetical protein